MVDIASGNQLEPMRHSQLSQPIVAYRIDWQAVVPQLHNHIRATEIGNQPLKRLGCRGRAFVDQRFGHRAFTAPGEHHPMVASARATKFNKTFIVNPWSVLLSCQLSFADGPSQQGIPPWITSQHKQVSPFGIGRAGPTEIAQARRGLLGWSQSVWGQSGWGQSGWSQGGWGQSEFSAKDGAKTCRTGGFGEADNAIKAVVVGKSQGFQADSGRFGDQFFRM